MQNKNKKSMPVASSKREALPLYSKVTATKSKSNSKAKTVKISFLGGLNEIGKNITLFEYNNDIVILDCGLAFPDADMYGVDLVIPDFTYVERNADRIRGIIVTHGHEDHIGSLPYLLKNVNIPVYSSKLAIGLIEGKLREHRILNSANLNVIEPGKPISIGEFEIEAIHVNHSIPDALGYALKCKAGTIVHTGDFKIDSTPIDGEIINLSRFAELGNKGVLCMLSDSTNAEREGYTVSEKKVGESFENLFARAGDRRLIVATFASNIHRVQQIINVAESTGRKVAISGRSLENVVKISTELGYLSMPEGVLIGIDKIKQYTDDKLVIITTGSQGEPMSALTRMAMSDHRKVDITANDYVIISATPIPGNEKTVSKVINELMKLGAQVVYERMHEVHVSGHACQEELKLMMALIKPKYFIPVHGEQKHLKRHAAIAEMMGIEKNNIIVADNGYSIEISAKGKKTIGTVPSGKVFVDGYGVGDVGNIVIRDRKLLSQDGLVVVAAVLDRASGQLVSQPDIISRGFVYVKESEELFQIAKELTVQVFESGLAAEKIDIQNLKNKVREEISRYMYEKTKRSPMILPIILEV